jgi:hypothetical protein
MFRDTASPEHNRDVGRDAPEVGMDGPTDVAVKPRSTSAFFKLGEFGADPVPESHLAASSPCDCGGACACAGTAQKYIVYSKFELGFAQESDRWIDLIGGTSIQPSSETSINPWTEMQVLWANRMGTCRRPGKVAEEMATTTMFTVRAAPISLFAGDGSTGGLHYCDAPLPPDLPPERPWWFDLPPCPPTEDGVGPGGVDVWDWCKDCDNTLHPGVTCYRNYPTSGAGQQCCYDGGKRHPAVSCGFHWVIEGRLN